MVVVIGPFVCVVVRCSLLVGYGSLCMCLWCLLRVRRYVLFLVVSRCLSLVAVCCFFCMMHVVCCGLFAMRRSVLLVVCSCDVLFCVVYLFVRCALRVVRWLCMCGGGGCLLVVCC